MISFSRNNPLPSSPGVNSRRFNANGGNAVNFTGNAKAAGYQDLGMNPQPGSIAVMNPAKAGQGFGHVAWVESVSGNNVTVSQYNYDYGQGYGLYSKMTMSKYAFDNFVKII